MPSIDAVLFAFSLFEKGLIPFSATRYRSRQARLQELHDAGALHHAGYASHILVPAREDEIEVDIEVDTGNELAWYRCPETRIRRSVPLDEARLLQLAPDWIKDSLCDGLNIPQHLRRHQVIEHDRLWLLGSAIIDRAPTSIYLARSMKTSCDSILQKLGEQTTPPSALVISLNPPPVDSVAFPAHTHLALLDKLYVTGENSARINIAYLEHLLSGSPDGEARPDSYLLRHEDSVELCLRGRKGTFSGIQGEIIAFMWENRAVEGGFSWKEITNKTHAQSRGIDDAMGGKSRRELWVERVSHGKFRIKSQ